MTGHPGYVHTERSSTPYCDVTSTLRRHWPLTKSKLWSPITTRRTIATRGVESPSRHVVYAIIQLTNVHVAVVTGPAGRARAVVAGRQVQTRGVVLARTLATLVDVLPAVLAGPARRTVARVAVDVIDAVLVVGTGGARTLVWAIMGKSATHRSPLGCMFMYQAYFNVAPS